MQKPHSIHFVGIKGVGMTPLAIIAKEAGITVTGSDIADSFITDLPLSKAGITPFEGFTAEHVGDVDLVITTGAHGGFDNPEVIEAKRKQIPVKTKGEAVGSFMEGSLLGTSYQGISIAGTHGKTTTSAMTATVLMAAGKDPGYLIGTSEVPTLGGMPGHFGKGQYFIAEADEYANEPKHDKTAQFLKQYPKLLVITNIDHDHPDIYPTLQDVQRVFLQFAKQLPRDGVVIICGDSNETKEFITLFQGNCITYGFSPLNDFVIRDYQIREGKTVFQLDHQKITFGEITLSVPGEHNALNAMAALLVSQQVGISPDQATAALATFKGTKRRLEYKGKLVSGALVYDDYAHHPTEVQSSLKALKRMYPERELICIFQPHTYSRTKELFTAFSNSFTDADQVILLPIYASSREAPDASISSETLAEAIKKTGKPTRIMQNRHDVVEYMRQKHVGETDLFVTMGAGDVYQLLDGIDFAAQNDDYFSY